MSLAKAVKEGADEIERCPECNSGHLVRDYERGELICEECGLVIDDQFIDQGPEWRAFDVEEQGLLWKEHPYS
jgi:transcription initiation factor TFIIB